MIGRFLGRCFEWFVGILVMIVPFAMIVAMQRTMGSFPVFFRTDLGGTLGFVWVVANLLFVTPLAAVILIGVMVGGDDLGHPMGP